MYSCLLIDHHLILSLTMSKIIRARFYTYPFEIHVESSRHICVIVKDAPKELIWQTTLDLEVSSCSVVYGFGETKSEATMHARNMLFTRTYT